MDPNPYKAPHAAEEPDTRHMDGERRFRAALLIGAVAPTYELSRFIVDGLQRRSWSGELGGFFVISALAGGIALLFSVVALWFGGHLVLRLVAHGVHAAFASRASLEAWDGVMDRSLGVLPWAAALGVVTWLVYSIGDFGGWPGDVVFGTIGNLLGAWCYVPLLFGWFRLWRGT